MRQFYIRSHFYNFRLELISALLIILGLLSVINRGLEWQDNLLAIKVISFIQSSSYQKKLIKGSYPKISSNSAQGLEFLGHLLWAKGEHKEARAAWLASEDLANRTNRQFLVGLSYIIDNKPDLAAQYWKDVDFPWWYIAPQARRYRRKGDLEQAVVWYDIGYFLAPDEVGILCARILAYEEAKKVEKMVEGHLLSIQSQLNKGKEVSPICMYRTGLYALKHSNSPDLTLQLVQPIINIKNKSDLTDKSLGFGRMSYFHVQMANWWQNLGNTEQERIHLEEAVYWGEGLNKSYTNQAKRRLEKMRGE